jgi:hypothetical protein
MRNGAPLTTRSTCTAPTARMTPVSQRIEDAPFHAKSR